MGVEIAEPVAGVTLVTLSNPGKRNALDETIFRQLAELWPRLEASSTRCVVLTGAGEDFSSGADLTANLTALPDIDRLIDAALLKTQVFRKPIVAAIRGVCVAGGLELALSCDVRLCGADARLGFPEARWGIFPAGGGALRLASEIGYPAAAELLLTGRLFDAAEAARLGLINRVSREAAVLDEAISVAETIAQNSPAAVAAIKTYLATARNPHAGLLRLELDMTRRVRASHDAREGADAFQAKRRPAYRDPGQDGA